MPAGEQPSRLHVLRLRTLSVLPCFDLAAVAEAATTQSTAAAATAATAAALAAAASLPCRWHQARSLRAVVP